MTVSANAKINLSLEVYAKRPDGYHALRSLVAPISLADTLEIELTDDGTITSDTGFEDDLCVRAVRMLKSSVSCLSSSFGARIRVTKRIPVGGGLGGGSADAAAVLRALNEMWKCGKTPEELAEIGAAVGSDVPALVLAQHYRQSVLMEGRGERVSLLGASFLQSLNQSIRQSVNSLFSQSNNPNNPNNRTIPLILANPGIPVSTAEIYRLCVPRTEPAKGPVNDLQEPAVRRHPEIAHTLAALASAGATDVRMSGSGATCFGFAPDEASAGRIAAKLVQSGLQCWQTDLLL